jgi:hypothetical protein
VRKTTVRHVAPAFTLAGLRISHGGWAKSSGEVELAGDVEAFEHKIMAPEGCLRSRIDAWTPACADDYGEACAWRARDHAVHALRPAGHHGAASRLVRARTLRWLRAAARDLAGFVFDARISLLMAQDGAECATIKAAPTSAYIAAHAARRLDGPAAYDAERWWQSAWLARRLGLLATP